MKQILANKQAAMQAAMEYQKEHGGQIIDDITVEIEGFTYGQIAVAFGTIDENNPTGERWEDFTYEP